MAYRPPIHYPRQAARPDARSVARAALERRALVEALKQRLTLILQLVGAQGAIQRPQVPLAPPAAPAFIPRPRAAPWVLSLLRLVRRVLLTSAPTARRESLDRPGWPRVCGRGSGTPTSTSKRLVSGTAHELPRPLHLLARTALELGRLGQRAQCRGCHQRRDHPKSGISRDRWRR